MNDSCVACEHGVAVDLEVATGIACVRGRGGGATHLRIARCRDRAACDARAHARDAAENRARADRTRRLGPPTPCRSCQALIRWAITEHGKRMPVNEKPVPDGNLRLEPRADGEIDVHYGATEGERFISHFVTCPAAQEHRKKGGAAPKLTKREQAERAEAERFERYRRGE